jgi:hypothetical protein
MAPETRKSHLTHRQRQLVELMQKLNFGSIEGLHVHDGEPVFTPPPRRVRVFKLKGENGPRREATKSDFVLKSNVDELFDLLKAMGCGIILSIKVEHGIPTFMTFEEWSGDDLDCTVGSGSLSKPPPISDTAGDKIDSGSRP